MGTSDERRFFTMAEAYDRVCGYRLKTGEDDEGNDHTVTG
jgi:hypothetical protein